MNRWIIANAVAALFIVVSLARLTSGCPFCSPLSATFSENIAAMDAVVIARLETPPGQGAHASTGTASAASEGSFSLVKILKGSQLIGEQKTIRAAPFGDFHKGDHFLIVGVNAPKFSWSTPMLLNDRQRSYLGSLLQLPKEGAQRLTFFQEYLEDPDSMLASDAFEEFARAPYAALQELGPQMHHDQLVVWIRDPNVPVDHRRLYLTMLGVCGGPADFPLLEGFLRGEGPRAKSGLDALIACYLSLRGPDGMAMIEKMFLKNAATRLSDNFADVYAAVVALRFHGTENAVISRARVLQALRHLLEAPETAELVVADFARWQDWSQLEQMVKLFEEADVDTTDVRLPIVNYVRACPGSKARKTLSALEKIDPDVVARAKSLFPNVSPQKKDGLDG